MIKHSLKIGLSFGLNSGIITTLGLIVGLDSGTHSKTVVIGGILTLAVADAFSDALGIHISEESENKHTEKEIWESTIFTFLAKLIFTLIFIIPVLLLSLEKAIAVSVAWGLAVLAIFSFLMAREQKTNPYKVVIEHLFIALIVIAITHYVGDWVRIKCG